MLSHERIGNPFHYNRTWNAEELLENADMVQMRKRRFLTRQLIIIAETSNL